jgi:sigma-B regulation protein RsbU (phosphoserine phosphatase)
MSEVLIVDDNPEVRHLLAFLLEADGYAVTLAADGDQALATLHATSIGLLLVDWVMPGMDGLELCRRIRAEITARYVYVLLLTGKDQTADVIAGLEAGADDFLTKPVDDDVLRVRLRAGQRVLALEADLVAQRRRLTEAFAELEAATARQREHLQWAADMQRRLLPAPGALGAHHRFAWLYWPAEYLAGDTLSAWSLPDGRIGYYCIDVSGHGVDAALLSVTLHHLIRVGPQDDEATLAAPADVVTWLNGRFVGAETGDRYFTLVYGVLDPATGVGRFCQAGHPGPIRVAADGSVHELGQGGFPVGLLEEAAYTDYTFQLAPGDRLVLCSDGLLEAENPTGEPFGRPRLHEHLVHCRDASPEGLTDVLAAALREWHGSSRALRDDVSVLVLDAVSG